MSNIDGDTLDRFVQQFSSIDETAIAVLKGHLLIEEKIDSIIKLFVFHPQFIEQSRLSFAQKLNFAKSMSLDESHNPMWEICTSLNTLRNDFAHSLNSESRSSKFNNIIKSFKKNVPEPSVDIDSLKDPDKIMYITGTFLGFLNSFHQEIQRFKRIVNSIDVAINTHRSRADNPEQQVNALDAPSRE